MLLNEDWAQRKLRILEEGMPRVILDNVFLYNSPTKYASEPFESSTVQDGEVLEYGKYCFQCVLCPGHICLYDENTQTMLTGDHILFDISPNISSRGLGTNALGDYINSLNKIKEFPVKYTLPAHRRQGNISCGERVEQLIRHYKQRLDEIEYIVTSEPGLNAYEIASKIKWKISVNTWENFPTSQKWFAVIEVLAHLDYLVSAERVKRIKSKFILYYVK